MVLSKACLPRRDERRGGRAHRQRRLDTPSTSRSACYEADVKDPRVVEDVDVKDVGFERRGRLAVRLNFLLVPMDKVLL